MVGRVPHTALAVLAILAAGLAAPGVCRAGVAEANLRVSARVPVNLDFRVVEEAPDVTLTAEDLTAGVKDLAGAAVLSIQTNSERGYLLELGLPQADWLDDVEVRAAGTAAHGPPGGVVQIAVPNSGAGEFLTPLDLRLRLAPGARTGTYSLPVVLGLAPL